MEFFSKVFTWFASLSSKLPVIDFKAYYIVVLVTILFAGICVALSYFGSRAYKLKIACNRITNYLYKVESIDDENLADFINQCISSKAPTSLKDRWLEYLNVRFGFPSDIVSEKNVYDKEVKNLKELRPRIFIIVGLLLLAIFAFWGFGTLDSIDMSVVHFFGLVEIAIIYLLLLLLNKKVNVDTYEAFYKMQEELDVKVDLQVEKNYSTDSSPLSELAVMVDEIIARNTAKIVDLTTEMNSADEDNLTHAKEKHETPIETLIAIESVIEEKDKKETIVNKEDIVPLEEVKSEVEETKEETTAEEDKSVLDLIEEKAEDSIQEVVEPIEENHNIETPIDDEKIENIEPTQLVIQENDNLDKPSVAEQKIWRKAGERIKREKKTPIEKPVEESVDPMSMYQDLIPFEEPLQQETVEDRNGLRIGKKVGLGSLDVEDVLMGSDFSEVEGDEEEEEEIEIPKPKKKTSTKKSNNKK